MNTIICAVDGTADSAIALEAASLIAERSEAALVVANVQTVNPIAKRSEQISAGHGIASEVVERHAHVDQAEVVALVGDPAIEIAGLAAERQASMIVVGARPKGRGGSMFRSRLQHELAEMAGVPVVIAPSVPQVTTAGADHASSVRPRPTVR